jgi:hypothetical protein
MLKFVRFGKNFSCYLQGECVLVLRFLEALDIRHIPLAACCLLNIRLPKKRPTNTLSFWRWQLKFWPKRWITLNIRRGSHLEAEVAH